MGDWNKAVIEEFRANEGKVGGLYAGGRLLLLTTRGRKSGKPYTIPLGFQTDADRFIIIAGSANPDWYRNLVADPRVKVEVGKESFEAIATPVTGEQREHFLQVARKLLQEAAERSKEYAALVSEVVSDGPVVALQRVNGE
jgi:deazaflavin-dependent oxidoreductase (nitroreductase family)